MLRVRLGVRRADRKVRSLFSCRKLRLFSGSLTDFLRSLFCCPTLNSRPLQSVRDTDMATHCGGQFPANRQPQPHPLRDFGPAAVAALERQKEPFLVGSTYAGAGVMHLNAQAFLPSPDRSISGTVPQRHSFQRAPQARPPIVPSSWALLLSGGSVFPQAIQEGGSARRQVFSVSPPAAHRDPPAAALLREG